jgi:hypothetical protein
MTTTTPGGSSPHPRPRLPKPYSTSGPACARPLFFRHAVNSLTAQPEVGEVDFDRSRVTDFAGTPSQIGDAA